MSNEVKYRTTLNGAQWMIMKDFFGGYALMLKNYGKDGYHFSGDCFKSMEDANAHLDKIDARFLAPEPETSYEVPADYYGVPNRYYGD